MFNCNSRWRIRYNSAFIKLLSMQPIQHINILIISVRYCADVLNDWGRLIPLRGDKIVVV